MFYSSMARILVIEDDELLAGAIQLVLEAQHEVIVHADPPAAPEVAAARPDVLIIDYTTIHDRAAAYIREIRERPEMVRVRVLISSGNHQALHSDAALREQCNAFLPKPFGLDELTETVNRLATGDVPQ
jgi:DNA-binding NarL/FixJ family response regulator